MYQTQDEFVSIIEQLYLEGMEKEADAVQLILIKYMAKMAQDE